MPKSMRDTLREKGWNEKDIERTLRIINSKEDIHKQPVSDQVMLNKMGFNQKPQKKTEHKVLFWVAMTITIFANLVISVVMIPFLMVLGQSQLYIILFTVGLVFGFVFYHILKAVEHIEQKHYVMAGVLIPALGLINIYVIVDVANTFSKVIDTEIQNPLLVSAIYVFAFILPYLIYKVADLKYNKRMSNQQMMSSGN